VAIIQSGRGFSHSDFPRSCPTEVDRFIIIPSSPGRSQISMRACASFGCVHQRKLCDEGAVVMGEGIQKISIFTDSQAALNRNQNNGIGPGQTWASAIIRNTEEIRRQNIQVEFRWVVAKTEKSTAQIYYQIKTGHALIGPHLKRLKKSDDDTCWWCNCGVIQSQEHLFKNCKHWTIAQNELWRAVKKASGRCRMNTSKKDLFGD
jgi:hypothetical protein